MYNLQLLYTNAIENGLGFWVFYIVKEYFKRRGIPVVLFLKSMKTSTKIEHVINYVKRNKIDCIIPSDISDTFMLSANIDAVKEVCKLALCPSVKTYESFEDKWCTYNFCMDNGIPTPTTKKLDEAKADGLEFPFFLKVSSGTNGGRGVWLIKDQTQLDSVMKEKVNVQCTNDPENSHLAQSPTFGTIVCCCREVIKQRRAESGTALDRLHRAFVSYDKELMMSALEEFKPPPEHLPSNRCRFLVVENKKCIQICNSLAEENPVIWTANEVVINGERSQARDDATFNVKYSQLHCYIVYDDAGGSKVYQNLEIDGPWRLLKSAKPSVGRLDKRSPGLFNCLGQPVESSQGAAFGLNEFNFVSYGRCSGSTRVEARDHIDRLELREACIILSVDDEFGNPAFFYMKMSTFPYSSSRTDELPGSFNAFAGKQQRVSTIAGVIGEQFTDSSR
jgi:hypothetical protein